MSSPENPLRTRDRGAPAWLGRHRLAMGLLVAAAVLAGAAIVLGGSLDGSNPHKIHLEAAKALATLATGLLLGGVLKLATDNHADAKKEREEDEKADREARAEAAKRYDALIADMHDNHDRLETARLLISAHRSAKTYGERMRDVIGAHVVLLKIARTKGMGVLRPDAADAEHLGWMLAYLVALQREYGAHYKEVSDLQRFDEEVTRQRFAASAKRHLDVDAAAGPPHGPAASDLAWSVLHSRERFPVLEDLCESQDQYSERFLASCHALAARLMEAKAAGLPMPPPDGPWPDDATLRKEVEEKADVIQERCRMLAEQRPVDGDGHRTPRRKARAPRGESRSEPAGAP